MKKIISTLLASCCLTSLIAQEVVVKGPDEKLQLIVSASPAEKPSYSITYNGKAMLEKSPLGMNTNIGDFAKGMKLTGHAVTPIDTVYHQDRIKTSKVHYQANELICNFENPKGQKIDVVFRVSNHDVAFRYTLPRQDGKGSVTVTAEETGFRFPQQTTTFLCPQSDAMIGWKRTKPYRVMSICMAMGEAVGIAAAMSASQHCTPRALDVGELQKRLESLGVELFD